MTFPWVLISTYKYVSRCRYFEANGEFNKTFMRVTWGWVIINECNIVNIHVNFKYVLLVKVNN